MSCCCKTPAPGTLPDGAGSVWASPNTPTVVQARPTAIAARKKRFPWLLVIIAIAIAYAMTRKAR